MKQRHIDSECSDEYCQQFLQQSFHLGPHDIELRQSADSGSQHEVQDQGIAGKTCHAMYGGLCKCAVRRELSCKLVRVLNTALIENRVKVGSLLLVRSEAESFLGFLGTCVARPTLHTMLEAHVDATTDKVALQRHNHPLRIITTHELFNQIASDFSEKISVEVWGYNLSWDENTLVIEMAAMLKEFMVDPQAKARIRKKHAKLRLGLKVNKKIDKRRQRASKPKASSAKNVSMPETGPEVGGSDPPNASEPNADPKGPDSDASHDGSGSDDGAPEQRVAEEVDGDFQLALFPKQVQKEALHALQLVEEHDAAVDAVVEAPVSVPSASSSNLPAKRHEERQQDGSGKHSKASKSKGSYFSQSCGLDQVGFAASARSFCYFCSNRISKGSVRFSWFHNEKKPSVWVHDGCLKHLVKRDGFEEQAKGRLMALKRQAGTSQPQVITEAVQASLFGLGSA